MNQMTAVEVVDPTDRYAITGTGYEPGGKDHHPAGKTDTIDDAILPYVVASDAKLVDGKVVGDPTEGALLVLAHKAGLDIDATREQLPRLATLPFDPAYKLMATFNQADGRVGARRRALLRQGRGAGGDEPARPPRSPTARASPGTTTSGSAPSSTSQRMEEAGPAGHGRRLPRPRPGRLRPGRRPARATSRTSR